MVAISAITLASALVGSSLAAPAWRRPGGPLRRSGKGAGSKPLRRVETNGLINGTATDYTGNWAGSIYNEGDGTFTSVTGTFNVPSVSLPGGGDSGTEYGGAAWVGIDGASCSNAILQSGIVWTIDNGAVTYGAWYEWFPAGWTDFSGISFNAGDSVQVTVTATSTTTGTATVTNLSNGQQVSADLSSDSALCQQDAEWIVEDYSTNGGQEPFANFGTVTFTNNVATLSDGTTWGPANGDVTDMSINGATVATTTFNDQDVSVQYTGP